MFQDWQIWVENNTWWILFFHSFPQSSMCIFHSHPLNRLLNHFQHLMIGDPIRSFGNRFAPTVSIFQSFFTEFSNCMHICVIFSTLTGHYVAEFSTPHPSFQAILDPDPGPWPDRLYLMPPMPCCIIERLSEVTLMTGQHAFFTNKRYRDMGWVPKCSSHQGTSTDMQQTWST